MLQRSRVCRADVFTAPFLIDIDLKCWYSRQWCQGVYDTHHFSLHNHHDIRLKVHQWALSNTKMLCFSATQSSVENECGVSPSDIRAVVTQIKVRNVFCAVQCSPVQCIAVQCIAVCALTTLVCSKILLVILCVNLTLLDDIYPDMTIWIFSLYLCRSAVWGFSLHCSRPRPSQCSLSALPSAVP